MEMLIELCDMDESLDISMFCTEQGWDRWKIAAAVPTRRDDTNITNANKTTKNRWSTRTMRLSARRATSVDTATGNVHSNHFSRQCN